MILDFQCERDDLPEGTQALLENVVRSCAQTEGVAQPVCAALQIIGNEEIHRVNLAMRNVDRPTDVLSFPTVSYPAGKTARSCPQLLRREYDPELGACFMGDILISLPRAREQAEEYGHGLRREIAYLTAHAMFHLFGYDHETEEERAQMRILEEKALEGLAPRE